MAGCSYFNFPSRFFDSNFQIREDFTHNVASRLTSLKDSWVVVTLEYSRSPLSERSHTNCGIDHSVQIVISGLPERTAACFFEDVAKGNYFAKRLL